MQRELDSAPGPWIYLGGAMRPWRCAVLVLVGCMCGGWSEASVGRMEVKSLQGELSAGAKFTGRHLNEESSAVAKLRAILKQREIENMKTSAKSGKTSCKKQTVDPYIPLNVSKADFIFKLIEMKVPNSCSAFELSSFQKCSEDFGVTKGCCTTECTAFLQTIDGQCWEDFQAEFCKEEHNQTGSMIDLLMRRCDTDKRDIQCLRSAPCDERVLKPKGKITMKTDAFAFSLGKVKTPSSCKNFELADFLECFNMIGVDEGCCDKQCSDVFAKIGDACWKDIGKALCAGNSEQPPILVDLLSQLCDKALRQISCEEAVYFSRSTVVVDEPLTDLDEQLLIAAKEGILSKIQALLVTGADVNARDKSRNSPLDWAAYEGHVEVIEALLQAGGDVDSRDSDGRTAIMEAAWGGHTEAVKTLIEGGSNVNLESEDGSTALIYAAGEGHVEAVEFLINEGSDLDAENDSGATALMVAAHSGHTEVVEALIDAGADTEIQDKQWGQTAIMWAAERGHIGAVQALLVGGSPKETNSKDGSTAERLAADNGHADIVALLTKPCKVPRSSSSFLCSREG